MKSRPMGIWLASAAVLVSLLACNTASGGGGAGSSDSGRDASTSTARPTATPRPSATPSLTPTPATYSLQIDEPTTTKIEVRPEDYVWVIANGEITLGFFAGSAGPDGKDSTLLAGYSTVSELPHGALLCRVATSAWELCGSDREFRPTTKGVLEFTVNDNDRSNNSGAFNVQVVVSSYSARTQAQASATKTPSASLSTGDPEQYLSGQINCHASYAWLAIGELTNSSSRPIKAIVIVNVQQSGSFSSDSTSKDFVIKPGSTESIFFAGPDVINDSFADYSCSVSVGAQWGD
jgi:hypothetical protein